MGFSSNDSTRETTKVNKFANEGSHIGATHGVVDIDPCHAQIRMRRVVHDAQLVFDVLG
jgi:hypothetical protein